MEKCRMVFSDYYKSQNKTRKALVRYKVQTGMEIGDSTFHTRLREDRWSPMERGWLSSEFNQEFISVEQIHIMIDDACNSLLNQKSKLSAEAIMAENKELVGFEKYVKSYLKKNLKW